MMTKKELDRQEKFFKAEIKRIRKLKDWYKHCLSLAEKRHDSEEIEIRQKCIANFKENEQMMLKIIDGIQKRKSGDVIFTKDGINRYRDKANY